MTKKTTITLRTADASNAKKIHALITANREEGRLLPRTLEEIAAHANRFVVALKGRSIVGCAELAPLGPQVAEVRSLAVDARSRDLGIGAMLVEELRSRARRGGFERFAAFTHTPGYFSRMGFSIVPHLWVTEKIQTDCVKCPLFRACGQYAMVVSLEDVKENGETAVRASATANHA
jgi:amino-acid N-acetyltransferase